MRLRPPLVRLFACRFKTHSALEIRASQANSSKSELSLLIRSIVARVPPGRWAHAPKLQVGVPAALCWNPFRASQIFHTIFLRPCGSELVRNQVALSSVGS